MSTTPAPDLLEALRAALAGQYDVERQLGAGGMGSVFLARDVTLDRPVAIKVIAPELAANRTFRDRFLLEARTVAKLRHPNIVAVYAAGDRDGLLYFVMECVTGESLRELLDREGRVGGARGARILHDLAGALAYAHAQGFVHRDIKPENVLIESATGRAMLTDFGVARALTGEVTDGRMTGTGFVVGSPRYMAPEQAAGERETDGRSDIYSLGLVGYEMFAGESAFSGTTAASILVKQLTERPAPLATRATDAPAEAVAAIDRALEKEPEQRWQTADEMAGALEGALAGAAAAADTTTGATRARTSAPRPAARTSAATAAATAAAATAAARRPSRRVAAGVVAATTLALVAGGWLVLRDRAGVPAGVDPRKSVLVAPFEVQSGDPSVRWLREGSVNMLALNMAQWKDLQVVNYERSLDLLRDAGLDDRPRIALAEARDMARRAGVWTVVMGVVNSTPDSLIVHATLYDVASGKTIDEAHRATSLRLDPRPLYDQLARDLLDLVGAPPLALGVVKTTTNSIAAYRAYLDGVRLLNSWRLLEADSALRRAIEADSTFALAYYRRTLELGWRSPFDPEHMKNAQLAVRYADRLPPRERDLVGAYAELAQGLTLQQRNQSDSAAARLGEAQRRYETLVRRDTTDAEAWYGLGDAYFHAVKDGAGAAVGSNYTRALRAFNRTVALDSTFHLAYSHKILIYSQAGGPQSALVLLGDSIAVLPDSAARAAFDPQRLGAAKAQARALAIRDASRWAELDRDAPQAQVALSDAYAAAGFRDSAAAVLERALERPSFHAPELAYRAASLRLAAGSTDALASLRRALARFPAESLRAYGSYQRFPLVLGSANVAAAAGSLTDLHRVMTTATAAEPRIPSGTVPTEPLARWFEAALQLGMGLPPAPLRHDIDAGIAYVDSGPALMGMNVKGASVSVPYVAFLATRDTNYLATARRWARTGNVSQLVELDALAALEARDTARAAALARTFPALSPATTPVVSFAGMRVIARAEVLAGLGDLQRALALYEFLTPTRLYGSGPVDPGWALYARSYLVRGQLYEQLGDRPKAVAAYERFLQLWKDADPALQAQLQMAREGVRRLKDAPVTTSGSVAGDRSD